MELESKPKLPTVKRRPGSPIVIKPLDRPLPLKPNPLVQTLSIAMSPKGEPVTTSQVTSAPPMKELRLVLTKLTVSNIHAICAEHDCKYKDQIQVVNHQNDAHAKDHQTSACKKVTPALEVEVPVVDANKCIQSATKLTVAEVSVVDEPKNTLELPFCNNPLICAKSFEYIYTKREDAGRQFNTLDLDVKNEPNISIETPWSVPEVKNVNMSMDASELTTGQSRTELHPSQVATNHAYIRRKSVPEESAVVMPHNVPDSILKSESVEPIRIMSAQSMKAEVVVEKLTSDDIDEICTLHNCKHSDSKAKINDPDSLLKSEYVEPTQIVPAQSMKVQVVLERLTSDNIDEICTQHNCKHNDSKAKIDSPENRTNTEGYSNLRKSLDQTKCNLPTYTVDHNYRIALNDMRQNLVFNRRRPTVVVIQPNRGKELSFSQVNNNSNRIEQNQAKNNSNGIIHSPNEGGNEMTQCPKCSRQMLKRNLDSHVKFHYQMRYICRWVNCGWMFLKFGGLKKHHINVHNQKISSKYHEEFLIQSTRDDGTASGSLDQRQAVDTIVIADTTARPGTKNSARTLYSTSSASSAGTTVSAPTTLSVGTTDSAETMNGTGTVVSHQIRNTRISSCTLCKRQLPEERLQLHVEQHDEMQWECIEEDCGWKFLIFEELKFHYNNVHSQDISEMNHEDFIIRSSSSEGEDEETLKKKYTFSEIARIGRARIRCEFCNASFDIPEQLSRHQCRNEVYVVKCNNKEDEEGPREVIDLTETVQISEISADPRESAEKFMEVDGQENVPTKGKPVNETQATEACNANQQAAQGEELEQTADNGDTTNALSKKGTGITVSVMVHFPVAISSSERTKEIAYNAIESASNKQLKTVKTSGLGENTKQNMQCNANYSANGQQTVHGKESVPIENVTKLVDRGKEASSNEEASEDVDTSKKLESIENVNEPIEIVDEPIQRKSARPCAVVMPDTLEVISQEIPPDHRRKCTICSRLFNSAKQHRGHMMGHDNLRYQCPQWFCGFMFKSFLSLTVHLNSRHQYKATAEDEQKFLITGPRKITMQNRCTICTRPFYGVNKENHMKNHDKLKYRCQEQHCGWMFEEFTTVRHHYENKHNMKIEYSSEFNVTELYRVHREGSDAECSEDEPKDFTLAHKQTDVNICHLCGRYLTVKSLERHLLLHDTLEFQCQEEGCGWLFKHFCFLKHHYRTRHKKKLTKMCRERCRIRSQKNRTLCTICTREFNSKADLDHHLDLHDSNALTFKCTDPNCGWMYRTVAPVRNHMKTKHRIVLSKGPFLTECELCSRVLLAAAYGHHLRCHDTMPKMFKCSMAKCGWMFEIFQNLKGHYKDKHKVKLDDKEIKSMAKWKKACPECGRFFDTTAYITHLRQHKEMENMFKCAEDGCGWMFKSFHLFKKHCAEKHKLRITAKMRRKFIFNLKDNKEEYVSCRLCDRVMQRAHYERHLNRHDKMKYQCPKLTCGWMFEFMFSLKAHISRDHSRLSQRSERKNIDLDDSPREEANDSESDEHLPQPSDRSKNMDTVRNGEKSIGSMLDELVQGRSTDSDDSENATSEEIETDIEELDSENSIDNEDGNEGIEKPNSDIQENCSENDDSGDNSMSEIEDEIEDYNTENEEGIEDVSSENENRMNIIEILSSDDGCGGISGNRMELKVEEHNCTAEDRKIDSKVGVIRTGERNSICQMHSKTDCKADVKVDGSIEGIKTENGKMSHNTEMVGAENGVVVDEEKVSTESEESKPSDIIAQTTRGLNCHSVENCGAEGDVLGDDVKERAIEECSRSLQEPKDSKLKELMAQTLHETKDDSVGRANGNVKESLNSERQMTQNIEPMYVAEFSCAQQQDTQNRETKSQERALIMNVEDYSLTNQLETKNKDIAPNLGHELSFLERLMLVDFPEGDEKQQSPAINNGDLNSGFEPSKETNSDWKLEVENAAEEADGQFKTGNVGEQLQHLFKLEAKENRDCDDLKTDISTEENVPRLKTESLRESGNMPKFKTLSNPQNAVLKTANETSVVEACDPEKVESTSDSDDYVKGVEYEYGASAKKYKTATEEMNILTISDDVKDEAVNCIEISDGENSVVMVNDENLENEVPIEISDDEMDGSFGNRKTEISGSVPDERSLVNTENFDEKMEVDYNVESRVFDGD